MQLRHKNYFELKDLEFLKSLIYLKAFLKDLKELNYHKYSSWEQIFSSLLKISWYYIQIDIVVKTIM